MRTVFNILLNTAIYWFVWKERPEYTATYGLRLTRDDQLILNYKIKNTYFYNRKNDTWYDKYYAYILDMWHVISYNIACL